MKNVLIALGNSQFSRKIANAVVPYCAISVCADVRSLENALARQDWALAVLDMALPGCDCLWEIAMAKMLGRKCRFLVLATTLGGYVCDSLMTNGVAYVMVRPSRPGDVQSRILDLCGAGGRTFHADTAAMCILRTLGIPHGMRGYRYLRDALTFPGEQEAIVDHLSCIWGSSKSQVERAMRGALTAAWNRREAAVWRLYFPPEPGKVPRKPTPAQFLRVLREQLSSREELYT